MSQYLTADKFFESFDAQPSAQPTNADYSVSIDPRKILKDPKFLKDIYDHYSEQGRYFASDEEAIDTFYGDSTWRDLNTVGAIGGAVEAYGQGKEARERARRIESVWRQLPAFWQEGGRGWGVAAPDIATAIIADPVNLIPGVAAYKGAAQAGRAAYVAGKSAPVARGALSGVGRAAASEAAISGGQEAVVNYATQKRDVALGLRDDTSLGEVGLAAGLGAATGGLIGGGIGIPSGIAGARSGIRDIDSLLARGLTEAQIIETLNTGGVRALTDLVNNTRNTDQFAQPVAQPEAEAAPAAAAPEATQVDPMQEGMDVLDAEYQATYEQYRDMQASGVDQAELDAAEAELAELDQLKTLRTRLANEEREIVSFEQSNDPRKQAEGAARRKVLIRARARFENLVNGQNQTDTAAQLNEDLNTAGVSQGSVAAPPSAADEAVPNTAQQQEVPGQAAEPAPDARTSEQIEADAESMTDAEANAGLARYQEELAEAKAAGDTPRYKELTAEEFEPMVAQLGGPREAEFRKRFEDASSPEEVDAVENEVARLLEAEQQGDVLLPAFDDIPMFRSEKQKQAIRNLFNESYDEQQFISELMAGKFTLGRDGKMTNATVKEIAARASFAQDAEDFSRSAAGDATQVANVEGDVALPDEQPEIPNISKKLRGEALASGLDWRDIPPVSGSKRITRKAVSKAVRAATNEPNTGYANQVQTELDEILDIIEGIDGVDEAFINEALPIMARDARFKSDAEDIVSLYEHRLGEAKRQPEKFEMAVDNFTQTERKQIKRLTRIRMQQDGLTKDVAELLATQDVLRLRDDPNVPGTTSRSQSRSSQQSIDQKKVFETAGRSTTGRIQSILRKGQRISKGSDYTVSKGYEVKKGLFAREEAMIRASEGKGTDLVPYETTGRETAMSPEGMVEVPKGTTLYADGVTKRVYTTAEHAMLVRGDTRPKRASTATENTGPSKAAITDLLDQVKNDGDVGKFVEAMLALRNVDQPKTPKVADEVVEEAAPRPPITNGRRKLIVQSKTNPNDVRIIGDKQIRDGGTIDDIIGKEGPSADPKNWTVKYAPMDASPKRAAAKRKLFESLPDEPEGVEGRPARADAGYAYADRQPVEAAEFESSIQILTPEQKLRIDQAAAFIGAKVTPEIKGNPQAVLGSDIMNLLTALHGHRWGTPGSKRSPSIADLGNFEAHMGFIIDLEKIIQDVEPRGIRRNAVSRQAAIDSLDTIFAGHSADEIAEAKRLVTNLAGNPAEGPMMRAAPDFGSDAARGSFFSPTASKNDLQIGEGGGATPKIQILNHEIGHWAYMNILTAQDRIDFWTIMRFKFRGETMDVKDLEPFMPLVSNERYNTNATASPQEYFAQQFDLWVTRNRPPSSIDENKFWKKIAMYVKGIYDRYFSVAKIDPDLEPLFAKILPDGENRTFGIGVDSEPRTSKGEHIRKRYIQLQLSKEMLEDAITRGSVDGIITAHEDLINLLFQLVPNKKFVAQHGNEVIFSPLQNGAAIKTIRNRQRDLSEMLYGLKEADDKFTTTGEMGMTLRGDPEQIAAQLEDFYYNGYAGGFEPSEGLPGAINEKNISKTSTSKMIEQIERALDAHYQREEGKVALIPDTVPDSVKRRAPLVGEDGKVVTTGEARKAQKARKKQDERVDAQAAEDVSKPRGKRRRKSGRAANPTTANSPKKMTLPQLRSAFKKHRGTDYGDQLAHEIVQKARTAPVPAKEVKVPRQIMVMKNAELEQEFLDAIAAGPKSRVDAAYYEITRRRNKRKARKLLSPRQKACCLLHRSGA